LPVFCAKNTTYEHFLLVFCIIAGDLTQVRKKQESRFKALFAHRRPIFTLKTDISLIYMGILSRNFQKK